MINLSTIKEVDSPNDRYIRHCYLTSNFDKAKISMAITWSYNSTSRKNSNSIIQWLADEPTAQVERTATY